MRNRSFTLMALLMAACLSAKAQDPVPGDARRGLKIPSWGTAFDLDGDCKFSANKDALVISVPGGRPHELAPELNNSNAPVVFDTRRGNFWLGTKVSGRFAPGVVSTQPGRASFHGAGLFVASDKSNVFSLLHGVMQAPGREPVSWVYLEVRINGQWKTFNEPPEHPIPTDSPVELRLVRNGSKLTAMFSLDGQKTWKEIASAAIPPDWKADLIAGMVAISTSKEEFSPRFSDRYLEARD